jgi:hypothetical protein
LQRFCQPVDFLQLCVPTLFQLGRHQAVARIDLVVLLEGPARRILRFLVLSLKGPAFVGDRLRATFDGRQAGRHP